MVTPCERGQGPPVRNMGFPLSRLAELPTKRDAWVLGGPVSPHTAVVVGSWFLSREVELSSTRACPDLDWDFGLSSSLAVGGQVRSRGTYVSCPPLNTLQQWRQVPRSHDT